MVRLETIIAVKDIPESSKFYQTLLGLTSKHGGDTFEILADSNNITVLCLHKWGEHEHPTMLNVNLPAGNGLILFFRVPDLNRIWENAINAHYKIEKEPHYNPNSLKNQFILRDIDDYYLIISE